MLQNVKHQIIHISTQIQDSNIVWHHVLITNWECSALIHVRSDIIRIPKFVKNAIKLAHIVQGHHQVNAHNAFQDII